MAYNRHAGRMNKTNYFHLVAEQNRDRKAERVRRSDPLRQTGHIETPMGRLMDLARTALPPGKRKSKSGNIYYERRENRSDRPPGRL
jgi:hypothetical protein